MYKRDKDSAEGRGRIFLGAMQFRGFRAVCLVYVPLSAVVGTQLGEVG